jgi:hypothetical protein
MIGATVVQTIPASLTKVLEARDIATKVVRITAIAELQKNI